MSNSYIRNFFLDEDGAVTVDWVVLTAAIVALGVGVLTVVGPAIQGAATAVSLSLDAATT